MLCTVRRILLGEVINIVLKNYSKVEGLNQEVGLNFNPGAQDAASCKILAQHRGTNVCIVGTR